MMPKSDTIDEIVKLNPTASPVFLAEFQVDELDAYLGRLQGTRPGGMGGRRQSARSAAAISPRDGLPEAP